MGHGEARSNLKLRISSEDESIMTALVESVSLLKRCDESMMEMGTK